MPIFSISEPSRAHTCIEKVIFQVPPPQIELAVSRNEARLPAGTSHAQAVTNLYERVRTSLLGSDNELYPKLAQNSVCFQKTPGGILLQFPPNYLKAVDIQLILTQHLTTPVGEERSPLLPHEEALAIWGNIEKILPPDRGGISLGGS